MEQHLQLLKQFVGTVRANTDILHDPSLAFFREFLEEMGAQIPPKKAKQEDEAKGDRKTDNKEPEVEPMEEEPAIPYPSDIDNSGVIEEDNGEPLPMGDPNKEMSDEDLEKANEARDKAMAAFSEGNFEDAVKHFTEAIELNPGSAILHAKRANVLLKLKRPRAAIVDCDKAISINPDSAQGYKFRGRAHRLLGKWVEAHSDLATACKLDYDDMANEWLKEVEPNAKKIQEYNRAVARQAEERELRERRERVRRAQEANRRAQEEAAKFAADGDSGAGGDPMGGLGAVLNDPEVAEAIKDPEVMSAFLDIMNNPANLMKHMGNPKVMKLIAKMKDVKGPMGGMFGAGAPGGCPMGSKCGESGCGGSSGGASHSASTAPPPKAPEPDLD